MELHFTAGLGEFIRIASLLGTRHKIRVHSLTRHNPISPIFALHWIPSYSNDDISDGDDFNLCVKVLDLSSLTDLLILIYYLPDI